MSIPNVRALALTTTLLFASATAKAESPGPSLPESAFASLRDGTTASRARLVTITSSYPLLRPTTRGRPSLDLSTGFIAAFPEEELLVAALAQGLTRLDLMARGAPNTAKTEQLADDEALLLLARMGHRPAALRELLEASSDRLGARHPLARSTARRLPNIQERLDQVAEHAEQLDTAYVAMAGGDYSTATPLLDALHAAYPVNPELQTQLGLARLGSYYASVRPSAERIRRLETIIDRAKKHVGLKGIPTQLFLRGQSPPTVRASKVNDREALESAREALALAYKLLPTRIEILSHLVLAEAELHAIEAEAAPELDRHLGALQRRTRGDDLPAAVWRTLALHQLLDEREAGQAERIARAVELFTRAGDADSLFNRVILDAEAARRLETIAPDDLVEQANHGGRSPSATSWPLGSTLVEVRSLVSEPLSTDAVRRAVVSQSAPVDSEDTVRVAFPHQAIDSHPFAGEPVTVYARSFIYCPQLGSLEAPRPAAALEDGCRTISQIQTEAP